MKPLRIAAVAAALLSMSACSGGVGGGGYGGGGGGFAYCQPGTSVTLANPQSGQSGVGSVGSIEIVANGNSNVLYQTYGQWQIQLQDSFGNFIYGNSLNLISDPGGYHPYPSDFFYTSSLPSSTVPGRTYTAYLSQSGLCQAVGVGTFSS